MSLVEQKLSRIDLNLLIALSVLLKEQNVSRAAELLFLSQSAMSRTLQRLREVFDDQLFIRASKGITPTVKALEIAKV
ncbi:MAG: LysR family transcriptional regulator, partial [Thalassotalea sp.]|nr:LysR family transcriptional regulator [Thalassotalea sp.]